MRTTILTLAALGSLALAGSPAHASPAPIPVARAIPQGIVQDSVVLADYDDWQGGGWHGGGWREEWRAREWRRRQREEAWERREAWQRWHRAHEWRERHEGYGW